MEEAQVTVSNSPLRIGLDEKTCAMVLQSEDCADEEENLGMKIQERGGGSGDTTAVEGLVRLRKWFHEPVPSRQEPLHDLLQELSDSYNPNKKKSASEKFHGKDVDDQF